MHVTIMLSVDRRYVTLRYIGENIRFAKANASSNLSEWNKATLLPSTYGNN